MDGNAFAEYGPWLAISVVCSLLTYVVRAVVMTLTRAIQENVRAVAATLSRHDDRVIEALRELREAHRSEIREVITRFDKALTLIQASRPIGQGPPSGPS